MRNDAGAVADPPEAVPVQEPSSVFVVPEAAFIQSDGRVIVASKPVGAAAAQLAVGEPE